MTSVHIVVLYPNGIPHSGIPSDSPSFGPCGDNEYTLHFVIPFVGLKHDCRIETYTVWGQRMTQIQSGIETHKQASEAQSGGPRPRRIPHNLGLFDVMWKDIWD